MGIRMALVLVLALAIQPMGTRAQAGVQAAILVKPNTGPPTLAFNVKGSGFGASETVDITFDGTLVGTATSSPTGSFTKKVTVPTTATPGNHTVTATGETSGFTASTKFLVRTNWARFHFDNANTGYNPYENVISISNVGDLVQKWAVPLSGTSFAASPIVAYGRVYVATTDGMVRAFDPATGARLWSRGTGGTISTWVTVPTAANNLIYIGNDNGGVFALSASTGVPVWGVDLPGQVTGAPLVGPGAVYVGVGTDMYALDPATGATEWSTAARVGHSPTLANGLLYTEGAGFECSLQALDPATGAEVWLDVFCSETGDSQTVAAANGQIYVTDAYPRALVPQTGAIVWENTELSNYLAAPSVANGVVFINTAEPTLGRMRAFSAVTGSTLWTNTAEFAGPTQSTPAVANGVVYVGEKDGLYAYCSDNGALLWKSQATPLTIDGSPAVSDGMVFASTEDILYAFGLP
jgi:outer membrane protein assembly factor BamB